MKSIEVVLPYHPARGGTYSFLVDELLLRAVRKEFPEVPKPTSIYLEDNMQDAAKAIGLDDVYEVITPKYLMVDIKRHTGRLFYDMSEYEEFMKEEEEALHA